MQLSIVGEDAILAIPVLQGDQGIPGQAAAPFRWQFPELTSTNDLPTGLGSSDKGKAWVVKDGNGTADIAYWDGAAYQYFADAFGPGLPGATPQVTATGEMVGADQDFDVVITGSVGAPNLHFKIPEVPGPPGSGSTWNLYDANETRDAGEVPVWDADTGKFRPRLPADIVPRTHHLTMPESAFTAFSNTTAASQLLGQFPLPARTYDQQLHVTGHVRVGASPFASARVAVEVRLGSATGQIVAKGLGVTGGICTITPHYSSQDSGKTAYATAPGGSTGRIAAGTTDATLFVTARRDSGSGGWYADAVDAQLSILTIPDGGL
ncbi:MAG: hypothetical protein INR67_20690 [Jatrophihabitans endophyticus]|nr:hypothetical protein [Jatrophihabitans endophyticus]